MRNGKSWEEKFPPRDLERAELEAFAAASQVHTLSGVAEEACMASGVLEAIGRSPKPGHTVTLG